MAAAFGLQPPAPAYSSKERSAVLSHDRDILRGDKDLFSRDREYYNTKVKHSVIGVVIIINLIVLSFPATV